jgi:hypothetical protein
MSTIDISEIRVGDFITFRAEVREVDTDDEERTFRIGADAWPLNADIIAHEPRALRIGDRVRRCASGEDASRVYDVVALQGAWIVVSREGGRPFASEAGNFEAVE